jgi:hypothetical protein
MSGFTQIERCRLLGDTQLIPVVNLGSQFLTGVFPKNTDENITYGPLELVWSANDHLLQLHHSFDLEEMYGDNYGYRSGLNQSMVSHLKKKIEYLQKICNLQRGDVVLDIGSNDGTTLNSYGDIEIIKIGIDPTANKFAQYYNPEIIKIPNFFSSSVYYNNSSRPAKIVTSIAMFYDLESPIYFAEQVKSILDDEGIWHFEQSYMPSMLRTNAYDTICHEHLEYYTIDNIQRILDAVGMHLIDVSFNAINGGSFALTAAKVSSSYRPNSSLINWYVRQERRMGLNTPRPFREFEQRIFMHKQELYDLLRTLKDEGKRIAGYGASTKGNVLLQLCGLDCDLIDYIVDINPLKHGCFTPGTNIPIIGETANIENLPDFFLVLPWHFREGILNREIKLRERGVQFIFPLPEIEIV